MSARIPKHKHELKEDKFISFVFRTVDYFKSTWKTFAIVGVIVVAIVIIMIAYLSHRSNLNQMALEDYAQATKLFRQQKYAAAKDSLNTLRTIYKSTKYGKQALLYLGKIALANQNYEEAQNYFKEASKKISNSMLRKAAMVGQAKCLQAQEKEKDYYNKLEEIAREFPDSYDAPDMYLKVASYYKEQNQDEQAKKLYSLITKKYKKSAAYQDAKTSLNNIKKENFSL
ncbi:MAG: tetratricopeptide repeat protein [Candidatus Cloacimonetes bacterium]|nr:tetratricopeptide repeat protein [Candidatus Cloacimonadota bacterium]MBS3767148.1 tetratricopeptide repeat protein [Candidatus Cloacimonadota bacterium]